MSKRQLVATWMVINAAGVPIVVMWSASCCWIEPELINVPGASAGTPIVYMLTVFPFYGVFVLANCGWTLTNVYRSLRGDRWRCVVPPAFTVLAWAAAFAFDGAHLGS